MAAIDKRPRVDGTFSYRIKVRYKGVTPISLTFNSRKAAKAWLKEHEPRHALGTPLTQEEIKEIRAKLQRENHLKKYSWQKQSKL